ncbi:MAG: hypothetical protein WKF87_22545 [Chryseolinea sp.]
MKNLKKLIAAQSDDKDFDQNGWAIMDDAKNRRMYLLKKVKYNAEDAHFMIHACKEILTLVTALETIILKSHEPCDDEMLNIRHVAQDAIEKIFKLKMNGNKKAHVLLCAVSALTL